jgi:hypothetical protein
LPFATRNDSPASSRNPWVQTGSVTAGRDVNFGLTPEQVKELTEAAARGATGPLTTAIVDLSKRLGVTEDATKTLLRIVGEQDVPLERLSETLYRVANDYKRLQEQAAALNPDNPMAHDLVIQARAMIDAASLSKHTSCCARQHRRSWRRHRRHGSSVSRRKRRKTRRCSVRRARPQLTQALP